MLKKIIYEPLLHFAVISVFIFFIYDYSGSKTDQAQKKILISSLRIEQLNDRFETTWQRKPTEIESKSLIENFALEEIYSREGQSLGLADNDDVVRKRMRQKMEFILQDMSTLIEPVEEKLLDFYQQNKEKYTKRGLYSFTQVFISTDRSKVQLEAIVAQQHSKIKAGDKPFGDNSFLPLEVKEAFPFQIDRTFGVGFANELKNKELKQWIGPIKSGYGLHFIYVEEFKAGVLYPFQDVRDKVLNDWRYTNSKNNKRQYEQELLNNYRVIIQHNNQAIDNNA